MEEVHKGRRERLRRRLTEDGLDSLQEYEVLEFLLYYSEQRADTNPLAHALIERFGSLEAVLRAGKDELTRVPGVGAGCAEWLACARQLLDRYRALENVDRPMLGTLRQVRRFAGSRLPGQTGVWQLCLNRNGMLLIATRLGRSGAWGEPDALRAGLEEVIRTQARGVIIMQKTEAARTVPEYDAQRTNAYAETLRALNVRLLDHVICAPDEVLSLAYAGRLNAAPDGQLSKYLSEP